MSQTTSQTKILKNKITEKGIVQVWWGFGVIFFLFFFSSAQKSALKWTDSFIQELPQGKKHNQVVHRRTAERPKEPQDRIVDMQSYRKKNIEKGTLPFSYKWKPLWEKISGFSPQKRKKPKVLNVFKKH